MAGSGKIYQWALERTGSKRAPFWMALLFLFELVLFIPLDAVLIFFCLQNRSRIPLYVLIATIATTLSAVIGYLLGHCLWDLIGPYVVPKLISLSSFENFSFHYQAHETLAVFLGAFLPFPMKLLSLSAGVFHLHFPCFFFYVLLARALRFSLIGITMILWGEKVKAFLDRHFHRVLVILGAKIAIAFSLFWIFSN